MVLDRRTFLQRAGLAALTLGAGTAAQARWSAKGWAASPLDRYWQALAQPDARKLALLVGVNQYPYTPSLDGCLTDVELQRELLVHRFGFQPSDVLVLTDREASRDSIETAFLEHLTQQAREGDVVVFHFSGYGGQVQWVPLEGEGGEPHLVRSLLLGDSALPTKGLPAGNDFLESTLVLLARSLPTQRLTLVLDTSATLGARSLQGNLRSRSSPTPPAERPAPGELAFQEKLLQRARVRPKGERGRLDRASIPGIVLAAAGEEQQALEAKWDGFSAGLFTYALTQYLWQALPATTILTSLTRTAEQVEPFVPQQPQLAGQSVLDRPPLTYYLLPAVQGNAEGVAIAVEEDGLAARIQLAGLPAAVLEYSGPNSRFLVCPAEQVGAAAFALDSPQVQVRSREGLVARARLVAETAGDYRLAAGHLVQELVRVLPRQVGLVVALDAALGRIERVDATSAFANIAAVASVASAGEQRADCLFGLAAPERRETSGYGLFSVGRVLLPGSAGAPDEAVKSAVTRLAPRLQTLQAVKLLRLTANEGSSRLGARVSLLAAQPQPKVLLQRATGRALATRWVAPVEPAERPSEPPEPPRAATQTVVQVPLGTQIRYQVENVSDRPLYVLLVSLEATGAAMALHTPPAPQLEEGKRAALESLCIEPQRSLTVPRAANPNWLVSGTTGFVEVLAICSTAPFHRTLELLATRGDRHGEGDRLVAVANPTDFARAVLADLQTASSATTGSNNPDTYNLDVRHWATLQLVYQVV